MARRSVGRCGSLLFVALAVAFAAGLRQGEPGQRGAGPVAFDVMEATIVGLQEAMTAGRITSRALVEHYLARVEAYDRGGPRINAFISLNPDALSAAAALDEERARRGPRGPLHGIPIVLKDNYDTADMPTTGGSVALALHHPPQDGFQVRKLRDAGAVILGKTNLDELAAAITGLSSLGGQTRNPYDPSRNPGGSSGGTAAAVAANFAVAGMGTDTCGSIRYPAAHNSLVGLRGTQGLASRSGIIPASDTQDAGGPVARTVRDLAIMLDATVGPDPADSSTDLGNGRRPRSFVDALDAQALQGARLGVLTVLFGDTPADEEVGRVVRDAIKTMERHGATAVEVTIPDFQRLMQDSRIVNHEFKFDLARYLHSTKAPVTSLAEILDRGLYHHTMERRFRTWSAVEAQHTPAHRAVFAKRTAIREAIVALMDDQRLDALVYPTITRPAARIGESQGGGNCALSANSGVPALTVPAGFTDDGLPVGLELLGRPFNDDRLLSIAYAFEQATRHRRPPPYTPALAGGAAPPPVTFEVPLAPVGRPAGESIAPVARFELDRVLQELRFRLSVEPVPRTDLAFAAIHRGDPGANGPVVFRAMEGMRVAQSGVWRLSGQDRRDLLDGRLYLTLTLYRRHRPAEAYRGQLRVPS